MLSSAEKLHRLESKLVGEEVQTADEFLINGHKVQLFIGESATCVTSQNNAWWTRKFDLWLFVF